MRLSYYRTKAIGLLFFSAIGLLEYRISDWRILETIGLSDIVARPKSVGLSDIGLTQNIGCPPLINLHFIKIIFMLYLVNY
jgi:hypothetical protein